MEHVQRLSILLMVSMDLLAMTHAQPKSGPHLNDGVAVVYAPLNGEAILACDFPGEMLRSCSFERMNNKTTISILPSQAQNEMELKGWKGYFYKGRGFPTGECGLRIRNVKESDAGLWSCTLVGNSLGDASANSVLKLEILQKPGAPLFGQEGFGNVSDGSTKEVTCLSYGGQPGPSFRWWIGEKEIPSCELSPVQHETEEDGRRKTFQTLIRHTFVYEEDQRKVRCQTVHEALKEDDPNEISQKITVLYAPMYDGTAVHVVARTARKTEYSVTHEYKGYIKFYIFANPKPDAVWEFRGVTMEAGSESVDENYKAKPVVVDTVGNSANRYLLELFIEKIRKDDWDATFTINCRNQIGAKVFEVKFTEHPDDYEPWSVMKWSVVIGWIAAAVLVGFVITVFAVHGSRKCKASRREG